MWTFGLVSTVVHQNKSDKERASDREGCPFSPYLFLIVMHVVFEQVHGEVRRLCLNRGIDFEPFDALGITFSELLFADDTVLFAHSGAPTEMLLHAVELISAQYGLKLNKGKCAALMFGRARKISFLEGQEVPTSHNTVYLGAVLNSKCDGKAEVVRRKAAAR